MNEYDRGYYDALKWVYEHTYGDNYKLQVKDKMKEFIKAYKKVAVRFGSNVADEIFLKESKDEKIRKALIKYFSEGMEYLSIIPYNKEQCVAWLEKQKESNINIHLPSFDEAQGTPIVKQDEQKSIKEHDVCDTCEEKALCVIPCPMKLVGQKPTDWSEEDEKMLDYALDMIEWYSVVDKSKSKRVNDWLKFLKDRVRLQNLTVTDEELAKAKKEAYNDALNKIEYHSGEPTFDDGWSAAIWYLKKRNAMPQTHWKPSDEQMDALRYVTNFDYGGYKAILVSLYEQLKKLRGE